MAIHLSRTLNTGEKLVSQSNDFYVHALRRDSSGMLFYTKVGSSSTELVDFHRTDGTQYPDFLEGNDYVEENTEEKSFVNHPADKYQQYKFEFRNVTYFIDNEGYFVARINSSYDYNSQGPK